jgi:hypothetical protein
MFFYFSFLLELCMMTAVCVQWQESEASIQYCILRELKPRRVIEIGSGTSTRFAAYAMTQNAQEGHPGFLQVSQLCRRYSNFLR